MGTLMTRFEGCRSRFRDRRNGGIGAFTPDNVPIFDWVKDNLYLIADSNHGFKMIGVGKLVADHLVHGRDVAELKPFRISRFADGRTFGRHNSTSPWV
jgi:glycine/D-amino acid oxidase-like deaminating enzyme